MTERYGNIVGWGMQVPERVITNQDLEKLVDTDHEWIVSMTGIRERHVVSPGETASELAIGAARQALGEACVKPRDTLAFVAFGAGLTWAAAVVKLGERTAPQPVDAESLYSFVGSGLGRAFGAVSGSVGSWAGRLVDRNRLN